MCSIIFKHNIHIKYQYLESKVRRKHQRQLYKKSNKNIYKVSISLKQYYHKIIIRFIIISYCRHLLNKSISFIFIIPSNVKEHIISHLKNHNLEKKTSFSKITTQLHHQISDNMLQSEFKTSNNEIINCFLHYVCIKIHLSGQIKKNTDR